MIALANAVDSSTPIAFRPAVRTASAAPIPPGTGTLRREPTTRGFRPYQLSMVVMFLVVVVIDARRRDAARGTLSAASDPLVQANGAGQDVW